MLCVPGSGLQSILFIARGPLSGRPTQFELGTSSFAVVLGALAVLYDSHFGEA